MTLSFDEILSQLVYVREILPDYAKNAAKDICVVDLPCKDKFDNFGNDCLLKENKLAKDQNRQYTMLKTLSQKEPKKDDELTDGERLERFQNRCNILGWFNDLAKDAERTSISSSCSSKEIEAGSIQAKVDNFSKFLLDGREDLKALCFK